MKNKNSNIELQKLNNSTYKNTYKRKDNVEKLEKDYLQLED